MQDIHWIYQERETEQPWALQVFHVYSKRKPTNQSFEIVLYSELIDNETNSVKLELDDIEDMDKLAHALWKAMGDNLEITVADMKQVERAIGELINR